MIDSLQNETLNEILFLLKEQKSNYNIDPGFAALFGVILTLIITNLNSLIKWIYNIFYKRKVERKQFIVDCDILFNNLFRFYNSYKVYQLGIDHLYYKLKILKGENDINNEEMFYLEKMEYYKTKFFDAENAFNEKVLIKMEERKGFTFTAFRESYSKLITQKTNMLDEKPETIEELDKAYESAQRSRKMNSKRLDSLLTQFKNDVLADIRKEGEITNKNYNLIVLMEK